jgi:hypothetical protein
MIWQVEVLGPLWLIANISRLHDPNEKEVDRECGACCCSSGNHLPDLPWPECLSCEREETKVTRKLSYRSLCVCMSESESKLLYDWRFTASHFVLATRPLRPTTRIFIFQQNTCCYSPYVTSSLTRGWVCRLQMLRVSPAHSFLGPSPARLMTTFYCLRFETPPTWRATLFPQEQDGPVIPPGTGFPFRRLLRLAGLRWSYSTAPPHGILRVYACFHAIFVSYTHKKQDSDKTLKYHSTHDGTVLS